MATRAPDEKGSVKERIEFFGAWLDAPTFEQILEMDDSPDERDFSKSLFLSFFAQARETFGKMEAAVDSQNLEKLSELGHFLKGSSATLGLTSIQDNCEKIQRFGKLETVDGRPEPDKDLCLRRIKDVLGVVQHEFTDIEKSLREFFNEA